MQYIFKSLAVAVAEASKAQIINEVVLKFIWNKMIFAVLKESKTLQANVYDLHFKSQLSYQVWSSFDIDPMTT